MSGLLLLSTVNVLGNFNLYPTSVVKVKGKHLAGDVESFYYPDAQYDAYKIKGTGFIIYELKFYITFADNNPEALDPELLLQIYFNGGGYVKITVSYYEGGSSTFKLYDTGPVYVFKAYDLTDGKTVEKVTFFNQEWWNDGQVYVNWGILYYG
ncbi:MAG: hypothetical protein CEE43_10775 [Promethearchaeota archaeon Loki_b32]|nr:MAG: hypothetical protein CEE43_10775 [Candidatus Lokiarchaeota archaeon Loki_b32]